MLDAEGVREALRGLCSKVVPVEETGECLLFYCRGAFGAFDLLVAVSWYRDWVYAKTVPEELVKPYMWHCSDVFYNPYGLYTFSRSLDGLVKGIASKERLMRAQLRLAKARLGLGEE